MSAATTAQSSPSIRTSPLGVACQIAPSVARTGALAVSPVLTGPTEAHLPSRYRERVVPADEPRANHRPMGAVGSQASSALTASTPSGTCPKATPNEGCTTAVGSCHSATNRSPSPRTSP